MKQTNKKQNGYCASVDLCRKDSLLRDFSLSSQIYFFCLFFILFFFLDFCVVFHMLCFVSKKYRELQYIVYKIAFSGSVFDSQLKSTIQDCECVCVRERIIKWARLQYIMHEWGKGFFCLFYFITRFGVFVVWNGIKDGPSLIRTYSDFSIHDVLHPAIERKTKKPINSSICSTKQKLKQQQKIRHNRWIRSYAWACFGFYFTTIEFDANHFDLGITVTETKGECCERNGE